MLDLARPRPRGHKINPSPGAFPLCRNGRRPKPFTSTESVATSLKVRFSLTRLRPFDPAFCDFRRASD